MLGPTENQLPGSQGDIDTSNARKVGRVHYTGRRLLNSHVILVLVGTPCVTILFHAHAVVQLFSLTLTKSSKLRTVSVLQAG